MNLRFDFLHTNPSNKYLAAFPGIKEGFKQKKTQEITTIVLTLVTLSLFALFAINPTLSTIAQLNREVEDSKDINQRLEAKIINLGKLQQQYASLQNDLPIIMSAVPTGPEVALLEAQFKTIAVKHGVTLIRSQVFEVDLPKDLKAVKKSTSFNFSITIEGTNNNVLDAIQELSNFDRILTIDSIAISNGPVGSGKIQINMRGKTYFKS